MRKLSLNPECLHVESFEAMPQPAASAKGTVAGFAAAAPGEETRDPCIIVCYETVEKAGCAPYTQDFAYPECVCDLSHTCPTYDLGCDAETQ